MLRYCNALGHDSTLSKDCTNSPEEAKEGRQGAGAGGGGREFARFSEPTRLIACAIHWQLAIQILLHTHVAIGAVSCAALDDKPIMYNRKA